MKWFTWCAIVLFLLFYGVLSKKDDCIFQILANLSGTCIEIGSSDPPLDLDEAVRLLIDFSDYRSITKDVLSNMSHLEEIVVESGDLINFESGALCSPPNLTSIQLNLNLNINAVSHDLLEGCANLEKIKIVSSRIINKDAFADLGGLLRVARFDRIYDRFFENLTSETLPEMFTLVEKFKLTHSDVKRIDVNFFNSFINLKEINLSCNKLRSIEKSTFKNLILLERLDLSQNDLEHFDLLDVIRDLTSLQALDLGLNNKIRGMNSDEALFELTGKRSNFRTLTITSGAFAGGERNFEEIQRKFNEKGLNLIGTKMKQ